MLYLINSINYGKLPIYAQILIPAGILLFLGALFAALLAFLSNKFRVDIDERVAGVREKLSGANCGGCGYAGCDAFAEALVNGEAKLEDCSATSKANKQAIAALLGITDNALDTVFVVKCNGGNDCKDKYEYQGYGDCKSMTLLSGGRKACDVGCMAAGTCTYACRFGAAEIDNNRGLCSINKEKCTNCGLCAKACPKGLIEKIPSSAAYYVACSNHEKGKAVRSVCSGGCLACGICVKACEYGAISLDNNLASIDYSKCVGCGKCAEKCPAKCIVRNSTEKEN